MTSSTQSIKEQLQRAEKRMDAALAKRKAAEDECLAAKRELDEAHRAARAASFTPNATARKEYVVPSGPFSTMELVRELEPGQRVHAASGEYDFQPWRITRADGTQLDFTAKLVPEYFHLDEQLETHASSGYLDGMTACRQEVSAVGRERVVDGTKERARVTCTKCQKHIDG